MRKVITAVCVLLVLGTTVDASAHRARRGRRHDHSNKVVRMKHHNVNVLERDVGQQNYGIPVVIDPGAAGTTVEVDYEVVPIEAARGTDFVESGGPKTLTFGADQHEAHIPLVVRGDLVDEANETLRVDLYYPRCTGPGECRVGGGDRNPRSGYVTIVDDEGVRSLPEIRVSDDLIDDDERLCDIEVSLDSGSEETVTVKYETKNGTATSGDDYARKSGTVTFSPGQITKEVEIKVHRDRDGEARDLFTVRFFDPVGGTLKDGTANCRFEDAGSGVDVDDD